jgi:NADPH:quinone reductase-like Zn-dependent oxidoreductase
MLKQVRFRFQLAKHLGAYVATTVSSKDMQYIKELGADEAIDYKNQTFEDLLNDYDGVYDTVGGETYVRSFKVLRKGGIKVIMTGSSSIDIEFATGLKERGHEIIIVEKAADLIPDRLDSDMAEYVHKYLQSMGIRANSWHRCQYKREY